eukprot:1204179-Amphidinium_carterae.1
MAADQQATTEALLMLVTDPTCQQKPKHPNSSPIWKMSSEGRTSSKINPIWLLQLFEACSLGFWVQTHHAECGIWLYDESCRLSVLLVLLNLFLADWGILVSSCACVA